MGGGGSSLISEKQLAAMHVAILEALPASVYSLEERRFKAGAFYDLPEFAEQTIHIPVFSALGLHEWSISHMWRHFQKMNETTSGAVNLWEFREYFDLPDDGSTTRLFRCFDEDRDNRIGFLELVVGLWTYCCRCNASVVCLCFDLYDTDHDGRIGADEFDFMIEDVFGPEWEGNPEAKVAHTWFYEREDALLGAPDVGMDAWSAFVSTNLRVQASAVRTQMTLQKKVIGVGFWTYCLRKRVEIFLGREATVEKILSAHVSQAVLEQLAEDRKLEADHDERTQFNMRVLRRTGPFPRRRKYRALAGKKLAIEVAAAVGAVPPGKIKKFATITVREAFERVTVQPGEDAAWEEVKPPSVLQALMSSLKAIAERPPPGRAAGPGAKSGPSTHPKAAATKKTRSPDALSLLKNRPGIDAPLGSPAALAKAAAAPASPAAGGASSGGEADPVIANAFHGLKPALEAVPVKGGGGAGTRRVGAKTWSASLEASSKRVTAKPGGAGPPSVRMAGAGEGSLALPTAGGARVVGGGKSTLSRMGKELVSTGEIGRVGGWEGKGNGAGGAGALIGRILA